MALALNRPPKLTYKVDLPGGQSRLREAILYICVKCESAEFFGLTKLNKMLWFADFASFAERAQPVTGRQYQRLEHGPAPVEMLPVLLDMEKRGEIEIETARVMQFDERRPRALASPLLRNFSRSDIEYFDRAIERFWELPAKAVSDLSHGIAWKTRENGDPMPYETSYFLDAKLSLRMQAKLTRIAKERGWRSQ